MSQLFSVYVPLSYNQLCLIGYSPRWILVQFYVNLSIQAQEEAK